MLGLALFSVDLCLASPEPAASDALTTIGANNIINAAAMVLSAVLTMALVAAGISVPGLFLLTGVASLGVAALFWRIAPGLSTSSARLETKKA